MTISTYGKKLIGKGTFSKVWNNGDGTVIIKSKDFSKEAIALFITGDRFPKIKKVEHDEISTYVMPKYDKVRGIKNNVSKHDWELYKWLKKNAEGIFVYNQYDRYNRLHAIFSDMPEKFADDRDQLLDALDDLSNYGTDIAFEISPRNIFIENGRLIFADCFFFTSQLQEVRSNKKSA